MWIGGAKGSNIELRAPGEMPYGYVRASAEEKHNLKGLMNAYENWKEHREISCSWNATFTWLTDTYKKHYLT